LWIHFDFICSFETQKKLHKIFRSRISDWTEAKMIDGAILTYHSHVPRAPTDSLYVCLNIPSVTLPTNRSKALLEVTVEQIPSRIKNEISIIASENLNDIFTERLETLDYEFELMCNNAPSQYRGAPIEEILRFASKGTEIALQLLDDVKTKNRTWRIDKDLGESIIRLINERLTSPRERELGLHFGCNPMGLSGLEQYLQTLTNQSIERSNRYALDRLYNMES